MEARARENFRNDGTQSGFSLSARLCLFKDPALGKSRWNDIKIRFGRIPARMGFIVVRKSGTDQCMRT
jgi:hypothetical protein